MKENDLTTILNRGFWLTLLSIVIIVAGCSKPPAKSVPTESTPAGSVPVERKPATSIDEALKGAESGCSLLYFQQGQFTGSGKTEYIVFYEDRRNRDPEHIAMIDIVEIGVMAGLSVEYKYRLENVWSSQHSARATETIGGFQIRGMRWNGYCFISDFNENGRDEILFFTSSGFISTCWVYEYTNGKMRTTMNFPGASSLTKLVLDDLSPVFTVYDSGEGDAPEGKRNWFEMKWDVDKQEYDLSAQGIEDWYDPKTGNTIN